MLWQEPVREKIEEWLSSDDKDVAVTLASFMDKVNEILKPRNIDITSKTAWVWLKELGWVRSRQTEALYYARHERKDVVQYRKEFLARMSDVERRMIKVKGVPPTELRKGERSLIFYTHDESPFEPLDGRRYVYHQVDQAPTAKKGEDPVLVSEFMSEVDGPIKEVRKLFNISKGHDDDGRLNGKAIANQLVDLIKYHKRVYPHYDAVVALDNHSSHSCYAADAPRAKIMNVGDGGSYRPSGMWYNKRRRKVQQTSTFKDKKDGQVKVKGIKRILQERGFQVDKMRGKCEKLTCPIRERDTEPFCCMMQMLDHQPDFIAATKTMVEQAIEPYPEIQVIYYPKFHAELNFIEMYWGDAKLNTGKYRMEGFQETVIKALDSVTIDTIRGYAGTAFRYMQQHREGLTSAGAEYLAMKKYTSQRWAS
ncbi:MAG: hypothetical protein J3Q66DRAFT_294774, partial [Benniella sp.]